MEVFENLISEDITNKIKGTLFSGMFPWYFLNDITFDSEYGFDKIKKPGHFHNFYKNSLSTSSYSKIVEDIVQVVVNHKKIPRVIINRARSFLQFPLSDSLIYSGDVDEYHVDNYDKHLVILYYVVSSDGDTYISNSDKVQDSYEPHFISTPKQGKILLFDGKYYHTAVQPKKHIRCVININITIDHE